MDQEVESNNWSTSWNFRQKKIWYLSIDQGHKKHCGESTKFNFKIPSEEKVDV